MREKERNNPLFVFQWKCNEILKAVNYIWSVFRFIMLILLWAV